MVVRGGLACLWVFSEGGGRIRCCRFLRLVVFLYASLHGLLVLRTSCLSVLSAQTYPQNKPLTTCLHQVIVTSFLFPDAKFSLTRLQSVLRSLGNDKERLVIDLSCRRVGTAWVVAMDKWQRLTDMEVNEGLSAVPFLPSFLPSSMPSPNFPLPPTHPHYP